MASAQGLQVARDRDALQGRAQQGVRIGVVRSEGDSLLGDLDGAAVSTLEFRVDRLLPLRGQSDDVAVADVKLDEPPPILLPFRLQGVEPDQLVLSVGRFEDLVRRTGPLGQQLRQEFHRGRVFGPDREAMLEGEDRQIVILGLDRLIGLRHRGEP